MARMSPAPCGTAIARGVQRAAGVAARSIPEQPAQRAATGREARLRMRAVNTHLLHGAEQHAPVPWRPPSYDLLVPGTGQEPGGEAAVLRVLTTCEHLPQVTPQRVPLLAAGAAAAPAAAALRAAGHAAGIGAAAGQHQILPGAVYRLAVGRCREGHVLGTLEPALDLQRAVSRRR
jgi:hypothetical protein